MANKKMMKSLSVVVRVALFALALILLDSSGETLLIAVLSFSDIMSTSELVGISIWSASYVCLGFVALFTAFKLEWLSVAVLLLISFVGSVMSIWNLVAVSCPPFMNPNMSPFLVLSCISHPNEYAGLCVSMLLAGSTLLHGKGRTFGDRPQLIPGKSTTKTTDEPSK